MDRRGFFGVLGGLGVAPLVTLGGCAVRDDEAAVPSVPGQELAALRDARVPADAEPALMFAPLRQPPR